MQLNSSLICLKRPARLIALIFVVWAVYLGVFTLTAHYIEGDDASTILYQLFDREPAIQRAFNPYHSGMDTLLSFVPNHEPTLRKFAFIACFLAGIANMFLLCFWLLREFPKQSKKVVAFSVLLPFLVPEMLFSSLLINPSQLGFFWCLLGLLAVQNYFKSNNSIHLYMLPLCFLIGVPFRWSLFIFIPVIFGYYLYKRFQNTTKLTFHKTDLWFGIALVASGISGFVGIYVTGYTPKEVFEVILWGTSYVVAGHNYTMLAASGLSMFTPAVLILLIAGIILCFYRKSVAPITFLIFSILPFIFLGFDTSYKFLITLAPVFVLLLFYGFMRVVASKKTMQLMFLILLFLPWIFGVSFTTPETSYGPGFEISNWQESAPLNNNGELKNAKISWRGGFALPTIEGPRPVFGYADVLLFGGWKANILQLRNERIAILEILQKQQKSVLMQDNRFSGFQNYLFEKGYQSVSAFAINHNNFYQRSFANPTHEIKILVPMRNQTSESICKLVKNIQPDVIYTSSTKDATKLDQCINTERISPFVLVLK